jgi:hypothetical protein
MSQTEIGALALVAFAAELACTPGLTSRGGNTLDEYREPPPFDATLDTVTDAYLERFTWVLDISMHNRGGTTCRTLNMPCATAGRPTTLPFALLDSLRPQTENRHAWRPCRLSERRWLRARRMLWRSRKSRRTRPLRVRCSRSGGRRVPSTDLPPHDA